MYCYIAIMNMDVNFILLKITINYSIYTEIDKDNLKEVLSAGQ